MRLDSLAVRSAAIAAGIVCTTTCQFADALKPGAMKNVALAYAGDSVLVVAAPVTPQVNVTVDGSPYADARLLFVSSDTGTVAVRGDTLVPKRRGAVTLTVTLVSSALPQNPPSVVRPLVVVADTVTLDSAAVRLTSLGDTVTLVATARDALGAAIAGAVAHWTSSDTTVAALAPTGQLSAKGNGTAAVRAMVDRDTALVTVTVAQQLTHWTFEPASLRIAALTDTASVVATGHDPRGNAIAALAPATWTVGDATIVTASSSGQVTSVHNGSTYLYAARGSVRDSVVVTVAQRATSVAITPRPVPPVTSLGAQVQLTARAFDRRAVEIQAAAPIWFTLEPGSVRVGTDGLVTALAIGTAHVVATLDAGADTAVVAISNDPATLTVLPDSAVATSLGDTLVFRAVARNGRGDSVAATVTWGTPDTAVVNLLQDGRAIARAVGTARLVAAVGSKADTGLAKVTNVPTRIDITPATRTYTSLGDIDTLPVTITNARGAALPRGSVTWSSDDQTIARVSTGGVVTAMDTGQTVVRATSGATYDSVVLTVQNLPATIVVSSPAVDTLTAIGQTLVLPAVVRNARGAQILNFPVAWRSTNRAAVDTVLPTGAALAIGWGSTSLIAQAGTAADTIKLAVQNPTRLYVSNALFTGLRVGTIARPYAKIQDAVNAADAGDTVVVLRGVGGYSESVALARRIVLLGDSAAYVSGARNPSLLPLLAHDTGVAAITATTTAPVAVKYLAVRHTLDGPAFTSDGSDVRLEWLYVNPPGTVTSRIGRGIIIKNSPSGTGILNSRVADVRGYGLHLENVFGASVKNDSVIGADSIASVAQGVGVMLVGGGNDTVSSNVFRSTQGAAILLRSTAQAYVSLNNVAGGPALRIEVADQGSTIINNFFNVHGLSSAQVALALWDVAGVNGPLIQANSFVDSAYAHTAPVATVDTSRGFTFSGNLFSGTGTVFKTHGAVGGGYSNQADGVAQYLLVQGSDTVSFTSESVSCSGSYCVQVSAPSSEPRVTFAGSLQNCSMCVQWLAPGGQLALYGTITLSGVGAGEGTVLYVEGSCFQAPCPAYAPNMFLANLTVLGSDDPSAPYPEPTDSWNSAIWIRSASYSMYNLSVSGLRRWYSSVYLLGSQTTGYIEKSRFTGNRRGITTDGQPTVGGYPYSTPVGNDVYDNDVTGFQYDCSTVHIGTCPAPPALTIPNIFWWGDSRGTRRAAAPAATGDSVSSNVTASAMAAPVYPGSAASALRSIRGDGQAAPHATVLPNALTVRAIDATGHPVSGVSVTFTVSGGGGNLAGQTVQTVTTNGDGLAETSFTLGAGAGTNTVSATGTGLNTVYFTATGT